MHTITTTQLRTQTTRLVHLLQQGEEVSLIHRSRVIGDVRPAPAKPTPVVFDAKKFIELTKKLNLPYLTPKQRERNYRRHMEQKYGKYLPGR
jgi:antitoxin (DNA-binding transcriptional repressor) of toxin-antitoxin stability system